MEPVTFLAVSGAVAWCVGILRAVQSFHGLSRRLRWALKPTPRRVGGHSNNGPPRHGASVLPLNGQQGASDGGP